MIVLSTGCFIVSLCRRWCFLLEREVAGEYNTFRVYLIMLKTGQASARDVAQLVGFSSPALAVHHLEKLKDLKLVSKDAHGVYHVTRRRFGILKFFLMVRRFVVPRSFFYTVLYGTLAILSLFMLSGVVRNLAVLFSLLGLGIHVIETVQFYKVLPKPTVQEVEQAVQEND